MISWYFASSLPIFSHAYSAQTILFLVTPRSTQSLSCDLFLVRGRIFFNPSQAMLASSIKINYYYYNEEITEAMFVVIPGAAETIEAIQPLLDHCPSSKSCCLVAICIKGSFVIKVDCIDTANYLTAFEKLITVPGCWKKKTKVWLVWLRVSGKEHEIKCPSRFLYIYLFIYLFFLCCYVNLQICSLPWATCSCVR